MMVRIARELAAEYPQLELREANVDAFAMELVRAPQDQDVVVSTNLFGDIVSDLAAQLVGGLGCAPSANLGADFALFEPIHGSAPDLAGTGRANPAAANTPESGLDDPCLFVSVHAAVTSVRKKPEPVP